MQKDENDDFWETPNRIARGFLWVSFSSLLSLEEIFQIRIPRDWVVLRLGGPKRPSCGFPNQSVHSFRLPCRLKYYIYDDDDDDEDFLVSEDLAIAYREREIRSL